jgi:hypothetical protein
MVALKYSESIVAHLISKGDSDTENDMIYLCKMFVY